MNVADQRRLDYIEKCITELLKGYIGAPQSTSPKDQTRLQVAVTAKGWLNKEFPFTVVQIMDETGVCKPWVDFAIDTRTPREEVAAGFLRLSIIPISAWAKSVMPGLINFQVGG